MFSFRSDEKQLVLRAHDDVNDDMPKKIGFIEKTITIKILKGTV